MAYFKLNRLLKTPIPTEDLCLTFSSDTPFNFSITRLYNINGICEYSLDKRNWIKYYDETPISCNADNKIYVRGSNNTRFSAMSGATCFETQFGTNVRCEGNIETLLDWETVKRGEHPIMDDWCFHLLFSDINELVQVPSLPAVSLSRSCYANMFNGCFKLTNLPENLLPATTLADFCYAQMFEDCRSLTSLPENLLPATTLNLGCYFEMFASCTNLQLSNSQTSTYNKLVVDFTNKTNVDNCEKMFIGVPNIVSTPTSDTKVYSIAQ